MAAQKRPAEDDEGGRPRHQPYVRVSNRQRLAQQKQNNRPPPPTTPKPKAAAAVAAADANPAEGRTTNSTSTSADLASFYRAWQWKREHLPDRLRFHQPYRFEFDDAAAGDAAATTTTTTRPPLTIDQRPFGPEGFASTVWDSSIVVAKMIERRASDYRGLRCCDLSAGCGLPAAVLLAASCAAAVVATDLPANLPLLRRNVERAAATAAARAPPKDDERPSAAAAAAVVPHTWGDDVAPVLRAAGIPTDSNKAFDVVFLCDGMYVGDPPSAVEALASSVARLVDALDGRAIVAHGRNRLAEPAFLEAVRKRGMVVVEVDRSELHPRFVCNDVSVYCLRHGRSGGGNEKRDGRKGGSGGSGAAV
jgi:predicted nicotinamide N-methyase